MTSIDDIHSDDNEPLTSLDDKIPPLECSACHLRFVQKKSLTRHKDKNRCLFSHPSTTSDTCFTLNDQNVAEVMKSSSSYKKFEMAKLLETCVQGIYPMIFINLRGPVDVPAVRDVVSVHGTVNNYKLLAVVIDQSPTGQVHLPKRIRMPCTLCHGELVLNGLTKPRHLSQFDVGEDPDNWLVTKKHRKNGNKKFSSDNLQTDPAVFGFAAVGKQQQDQSASDYSVWSSMNTILGLI